MLSHWGTQVNFDRKEDLQIEPLGMSDVFISSGEIEKNDGNIRNIMVLPVGPEGM